MENYETMKICQSCGMPMVTEDLYGTNADETKNDDYCTYCYQKGTFAKPDETLEEMVATCIPFMTQDNPTLTEEAARAQLMDVLPNLKRWKH